MATELKQRGSTGPTGAKGRDEAPADVYQPNIVYLKTDPQRQASVERRKYEELHPETVDWSKRLPHRSHQEFGGPIGVTLILVCSHVLIWWFTLCLQLNRGELILPRSVGDFLTLSYTQRIYSLLIEHTLPSFKILSWYWGFLTVQGIFAVTLPGIHRLGEPLPSLQGKKLTYLCNALASFWATALTLAALHFTGIFRYSNIIDNIAPLATTAMLTADAISVAIYFNLLGTGESDPDISHNFLYDFFMGVTLNPRLGKLDIKMFFEVRVSWIMMTIITTSAAYKFYELHGYLSNNMLIITAGITIYSYSVMKGEHLILPTWDITTEFYGNMLCFWNSALPFLYSAQSIFILRRDPAEIAIPDAAFYAMMAILVTAYYCFDTVNSQKNTFRQFYNETWEPSPIWYQPQFSFGTIENPKYLRTKAGTPLLLDGWYAYARKWQYTSDVIMGSMWCLSCGFNLFFIPKFYIMFFVGMLYHRCLRDEEKCAHKYGQDWVEYTKQVKYRFIPYVY